MKTKHDDPRTDLTNERSVMYRKIIAMEGKQLEPIAPPSVCKNRSPLKLTMFVVSTALTNSTISGTSTGL